MITENFMLKIERPVRNSDRKSEIQTISAAAVQNLNELLVWSEWQRLALLLLLLTLSTTPMSLTSQH